VPPGITFEKLSFRSYRGTVLTASGEAVRATLRRDTSAVAAEDIRVLLPSPPAGGHLVEAPRGEGNLRAGEGHLRGGVVVTLRAGRSR